MRGGRPQVVNIVAPMCTGACARNSVQNGIGKNGIYADQHKKRSANLLAKLHAMHMMRMCFQYAPHNDCLFYHRYHKVSKRSNSKRRRDTTPILMQRSQLCAGACRHIGVATRRINSYGRHVLASRRDARNQTTILMLTTVARLFF